MKIFTTLLSIAFLTFAKAQDSSKAAISMGLELGPESTFVKDLYRSPYLYSGMNTYGALSLNRSAKKSLQSLRASYSFGKIQTSFSPKAPQDKIQLEYLYLRKVFTRQAFQLYVGPQLNALAWQVNYFPEMEVPLYARVHSYLVNASLGIGTEANFQISKRSSLSISATVALASYVQRPHFMDGHALKPWGVFNLWNPSIRVVYSYSLSRKVAITVGYQYSYVHYDQPKAIRMLNNGLSIGLKVRL